MKLFSETAIRKQADEPTIAMLNLWQPLSEKKVGAPIEVMVGNRKDHPQMRSFSGELYTAYPTVVEGEMKLVLWLDRLSDVPAILITHEIGHWVLKLQGFPAFQRRRKKHSNMEILLNSMAHHPSLYVLQISICHDPQAEVDSRCIHNIKLFSKGKELKQRKLWVNNALMLADDAFNSENNRQILINVLRARHPNTLNLLRKLIELESSYDL